MSRRANVNVVAVLLGSVLAMGALALPGIRLPILTQPTLASAHLGPELTGGAPLAGTKTLAAIGGADGAHDPGVVRAADLPVAATGNGITIEARSSTLIRQPLRFTGHVPASSAGAEVVIERLGPVGGWLPTASALAGPAGGFTAVWSTNHIGRFAIRAVVQGTGASRADTTAASPALAVTVYLPAIATIFGQGFYGSTTACGQVLEPGTLGVAHRWLKCGTPVSIYWHGHTIVVPVIDRGPYANHADWDLTEATGRLLGMYDTETIGAIALRR